ncbi:MAG: hypothetical protein K2P80_12180 [Beijerinckiaceae bacterium]|nr:hypothetical protein [Beijerinckiaceae bacterium]
MSWFFLLAAILIAAWQGLAYEEKICDFSAEPISEAKAINLAKNEFDNDPPTHNFDGVFEENTYKKIVIDQSARQSGWIVRKDDRSNYTIIYKIDELNRNGDIRAEVSRCGHIEYIGRELINR